MIKFGAQKHAIKYGHMDTLKRPCEVHLVSRKNSNTTSHKARLFQASIIDGGGSFINRAYPIYISPFGKDGVPITSFSSIQVVKTCPALYKKKPTEMYEIDYIMFRSHLDRFIDVSLINT